MYTLDNSQFLYKHLCRLEDSAAWMKRFVLLENRSLLFYLSDDTTCMSTLGIF